MDRINHHDTTATSDRRRRIRVQGDAPGWILPPVADYPRHTPADEEAWEVLVHDVSRFGVGFTSTAPMRLGEEHRLRIGRGPMHRARPIKIVACRQNADGAYTVGAEFTDVGSKVLAKAG
jgi:hypothetical protein